MDLTKLPRGLNWDSSYIVDKPIGQGSMAYIYRASVNLAQFDFAGLIAYWEAQKENVPPESIEAYCNYRKDIWDSQSQDQLIAYCREQEICFPEGQVCALKVLKEKKHIERFFTEWQKTIGLREPHLLQVYGGGKFQEAYYYSMEYISNPCSLSELYKLSLREKIELILQAAKGLGTLHKMQVIHRDVKLDNLIVYRDGGQLRLKIADLGIAKNSDANYTRTNQLLGTPNFMAPEQVKSSKSVSYLSDVYSLGATLYELVCEKPPYSDLSLQAILKNINEEVAPVSAKKFAPPEVNRIIKYLMAFKPSGRPQSMKEVEEVLQNYLDGKAVYQEKKTTTTKKRRRQTTKGIPIQKSRNRVARYKESAQNDSGMKKEMYFKLAAILICPLLLVLYLLFPELITAKVEDNNRGLRKKRKEIIHIPSVNKIKKKVTLENKIRGSVKTNRIVPQLVVRDGQWHKEENGDGWYGFAASEETQKTILDIHNFPDWKDYEVTFNVKVLCGSVHFEVQEFEAPMVLTELFKDIALYPKIEFKITLTVLGRDLLIDRQLASSSKTTAPKKLHTTKSVLKKVSGVKNKATKVAFSIQKQGKFPGCISISRVAMRKISSKDEG
ncbi:serine/threonine protein kinase [Candidatus Uabimicrobium sp. HlEnr_7]|uniref:serine/threonine protein kinase n=1 Tax=Candidatus Uabimicrobium helgolandensis TaxID=3095367 RepID=UPI003557C34D